MKVKPFTEIRSLEGLRNLLNLLDPQQLKGPADLHHLVRPEKVTVSGFEITEAGTPTLYFHGGEEKGA